MMFSQKFEPMDIEFLGDESLEIDAEFDQFIENENQQQENQGLVQAKVFNRTFVPNGDIVSVYKEGNEKRI